MISNSLKTGLRYPPFRFTEDGVSMPSSVLRGDQAVQINIQIRRVYRKMKELLVMHKDILLKLEKVEKKTGKHDADIKLIFGFLKKLIEHPKEKTQRIGFKKDW